MRMYFVREGNFPQIVFNIQVQTPSPFLHPAQAPHSDAQMMAMAMPAGYGLDMPNMTMPYGGVPMTAYNEQTMGNFGQGGLM